MSEETGTWYRVALNTIVRRGVKLDSERLRILPMGSRVCVVEQIDRRVRIVKPVNGWCSIKSSSGDVILSKLGSQEQAGPVSTPRIREEKANLEKQMTKVLKEHEGIKEEFEKQKRGKENKLAEAISQIETESTEKSNEIRELKNMLHRLDDLNAQLKIKELKMQQQQKILDDMGRVEMGDSEMLQQKQTQRIFRENDVVALDKKVGGGFGIVKYYAKENDVEIIGVQFSGPMNTSDPGFTGEPHFNCEPGCGAYIRTTHIKKIVSSEELLHKLNKQIAIYLQVTNAGE